MRGFFGNLFKKDIKEDIEKENPKEFKPAVFISRTKRDPVKEIIEGNI